MTDRGFIPRWAALGLALTALILGVGTAQGSDVSSQATGHISNGSGNVESDIRALTLSGVETRFRADPIRPGTREVIAIAVALCDGGTLSTTSAQILVPVAGASPRIAGGLSSIPCIASPGSDGLATGFNGGVVTFQGPLAQYMGTTRIYADTRPQNGTFFEPGELVAQGVPNYNAGTNEAIVTFGRQGQMLTDSSGNVVADTSDRDPLVLIVTVDVDNNAPSGQVDVALGLGVGDDTAQGTSGICYTNLTPSRNCGSNLMRSGPARDAFQVTAQGGGTTPPPGGGGGSSIASQLRPYDQNGNDRLEDNEFMSVIDDWTNRRLSDKAFFTAIDLWINQNPISSAGMARVQTRTTPRGIQFSANNASSLSVEVFGLDGRPVFSETASGSTLHWDLRAFHGEPVANGVYLYRATWTSPNGRSIPGEVRKLVVTR